MCGFFPGSVTQEWVEGETCAEQENSWEGACFARDLGDICVLIDAEDSDAAESICLGDESNEWFPGSLTCDVVPALPVAGHGTLVLLLLGGALVVLKLR